MISWSKLLDEYCMFTNLIMFCDVCLYIYDVLVTAWLVRNLTEGTQQNTTCHHVITSSLEIIIFYKLYLNINLQTNRCAYQIQF